MTLIGRAVLVREYPAHTRCVDGKQVIVRVVHPIPARAVANLEVHQVPVTAIGQLVADPGAGPEPDAVALGHRELVIAEQQCGLAAQDVEEFVLLAVAVKQGG